MQSSQCSEGRERTACGMRRAVAIATVLLGLVGGVNGAYAGPARFAVPSFETVVTRAGQRCATRMQPREIIRNQFVVDRLTECEPVAVGPALDPDTIVGLVREIARALQSDGTRASDPVDADVAAPTEAPTRERRPSWSVDRSRLSNAQYDRSVDALRASIRRAER